MDGGDSYLYEIRVLRPKRGPSVIHTRLLTLCIYLTYLSELFYDSICSLWHYTVHKITCTKIQSPQPFPLAISTLTAMPLEGEIAIHVGKKDKGLKDNIMSWRETVERMEMQRDNDHLVS